MGEALETLGQLGVVPVVTIEQAEDAVPLANALLAAGLPCAEITFRTAAAENAIRQICAEVAQVVVGAGTVLSAEQAEKAVAAGARFIVSPGFDAEVVEWCQAHDVAVIPGVATATEINTALGRGLTVLKFFPAEALGGIGMLKALAAPYRGVRFVPTGGIGPKNLADYVSLPAVHACGGSWLVKKSLISAGRFAEITRLAEEALDIVGRARADP